MENKNTRVPILQTIVKNNPCSKVVKYSIIFYVGFKKHFVARL